MKRQKGELFAAEGGHLRKMGFGESLRYRLSSCCPKLFGKYAERVSSEVRTVIDTVTSSLRIQNQGDYKHLKNFYFTSLPSLSRRVYSRKIHKSIREYLKTQLEYRWVPETTINFQNEMKRAQLWAALGNFEMLGGSSGSYRILDENENPIGVCKLADEEPLAENNPRFSQQCKRRFHAMCPSWSRASLFKTIAGQAYLAESVTYKIATWVEAALKDPSLNLVPETHVVKIDLGLKKEKKGSFQLWIQGDKSTAAEHLGADENYENISKPRQLLRSIYNVAARCFGWTPIERTFEKIDEIPDDLIDYLALVDILTANHDRHAENWYLMKNEKGEIKDIRLIDGGWSMSPYHPPCGSHFLLRHQYLWRLLPIAKNPFSQKAIEAIEKLHGKLDELEAMVKSFYEEHGDDMAAERAACFKDRLEVLFKMRYKAKAEVAKIRSESEIRQAIAAAG
ncbi:MAG: hypothetical protein JSS32_05075 [Verrucomicrobia bacterium]|nr:hypothetical protein [Verrucomicrobiota bacterium]